MWNERNISEHIDWILAIEKKLPVEEWTIDGVHIWPLLRMRLNFIYFVDLQSADEPVDVAPSKRSALVTRLWKMHGSFLNSSYHFLVKLRLSAPTSLLIVRCSIIN